jgi:hypothetical protein
VKHGKNGGKLERVTARDDQLRMKKLSLYRICRSALYQAESIGQAVVVDRIYHGHMGHETNIKVEPKIYKT